MKKTFSSPSHPHVKWEILVLGMIAIIIEIALVILNFCKDSLTDAPLFVAVLAAYGWIFGLLAAMLGVTAIIEEFLPSYKKYKTFKQLEAQKATYIATVVKLVQKSIRSNQRRDFERYVQEHPKYQ